MNRPEFLTLPVALGALIAVCLSELAQGGGIPCRYSVEIIMQPTCDIFGTPTLTSIYPTDINDSGVACGYWLCPTNFTPHAWVWDKVNGFRAPALPSGTTSSNAYAISESGVVYGTFEHPHGGGAFRSEGETATVLGLNMASMADTSDSEVVVGTWGPAPDVFAPFRWSAKSGFQDLAPLLGGQGEYGFGIAISADGTTCGWYRPTPASFFHSGFLIGPDNSVEIVSPVAGGLSSELVAINASNTAVGFSRVDMVAGGLTLGLIYKNGQTVAPPVVQMPGDLDTNVCSTIWDIADDGTYIGGWRLATNPMTGLGACIVRHGHVERLRPLFAPAVPQQLLGIFASRLNNAKQILGTGVLPPPTGGTVGVVATPVWPVAGDTDCDQIVNVTDLLNVISHWQDDGGRPDVNDDGIVDHIDLLDVIRNWSSAGAGR